MRSLINMMYVYLVLASISCLGIGLVMGYIVGLSYGFHKGIEEYKKHAALMHGKKGKSK